MLLRLVMDADRCNGVLLVVTTIINLVLSRLTHCHRAIQATMPLRRDKAAALAT